MLTRFALTYAVLVCLPGIAAAEDAVTSSCTTVVAGKTCHINYAGVGKVTYSLAGGTSGGTFKVDAKGAVFKARKAGTPSTITVTVDGKPLSGPAITVTPGPPISGNATMKPTKYKFKGPQKFYQEVPVTVTLRDAYGNITTAGRTLFYRLDAPGYNATMSGGLYLRGDSYTGKLLVRPQPHTALLLIEEDVGKGVIASPSIEIVTE